MGGQWWSDKDYQCLRLNYLTCKPPCARARTGKLGIAVSARSSRVLQINDKFAGLGQEDSDSAAWTWTEKFMALEQ